MTRRQLAEPIGRNLQSAIEPRAKILERDYRSHFDDLAIVEMPPEFLEHGIGYVD